ncbi:hypothetical protein [Tabrizicola aquatica]|uniref:hypothetical protein n=1 Tax=Tabrizicola aquatica TaxID=909926 RepID=UPI000CD1FE2E|nr:hypothetical protein [Tabrizicola aquatica]
MARYHVLLNAVGEPVWVGTEPVEGAVEVEAESPAFLAAHALGSGGRWVRRKLTPPPAPTAEEQAAARAAEREAARQDRREAVRVAMEQEADPVFFEWQRGEATQADWLAAVAAVRARFPKPEG